MSPKTPVLAATLSFFLVTLWVIAAGESVYGRAPNPVEWKLTQHTEEMGKTEVMIVSDAAHVYCPRLGCHFLAKAPDWQVHCYRLDEKVEWVGAMEQFNGLVMANPFSAPKPFSSPKCKTIGKGEMDGLKYTKLTTGNGLRNLLYTADDIKVAPKVGEFLARLYFIPNTDLVPLYRITTRYGSTQLTKKASTVIEINSAQDLRSGAIIKLQTLAWQKVPLKSSDFASPKGFKQSPDIIQVTYSASRKSEVNDMLDNIGFTEESNKLVKPSQHAKVGH